MKYRRTLGMVAMVAMVGFLVGLAPSDAEAAKKKMVKKGEFKVTSISGVLGFGTESVSDTGTALALGVGAAFYHPKNNIDEVRVDLTYLTADDGPFEVTRIPIIFSGRMYFPQDGDMTFYAQGGLGFSFDKVEFPTITGKGSESETNIDLVPAGGIQFQVNPNTTIGGELALHLTDDSYFTILFKADFAVGK